jgi:hypothetical protein
MEGWIKIYRKFAEWEWFEDSHMVHLFIYLLLSANHEEGTWRGIIIKRGQLITGLNSLNKKTKISIRILRTCLDRLKKTKEIDIQTTNKYSIITICNFECYQSINGSTDKQIDKQTTFKRQTTDKQTTTNNNTENNNNEKNDKNIYPTFEEFKIYALENNPEINVPALELKYKAWIENNWRDGNNKKIVNWKTKLLNTIPYLKNKNDGSNRQYSERNEKRVNDLWDKTN